MKREKLLIQLKYDVNHITDKIWEKVNSKSFIEEFIHNFDDFTEKEIEELLDRCKSELSKKFSSKSPINNMYSRIMEIVNEEIETSISDKT